MKLAEEMTTKHLNHYNWPKLVLLGHDWLTEMSNNVACKLCSQSLIKLLPYCTTIDNKQRCLSVHV